MCRRVHMCNSTQVPGWSFGLWSGGVAGRLRVHGTGGVGHSVKASPLSKLVLIVLLREISWASLSPVSSHPPSHATSKQTHLAKVGTGEDGRFLPAGNDIGVCGLFQHGPYAETSTTKDQLTIGVGLTPNGRVSLQLGGSRSKWAGLAPNGQVSLNGRVSLQMGGSRSKWAGFAPNGQVSL